MKPTKISPVAWRYQGFAIVRNHRSPTTGKPTAAQHGVIVRDAPARDGAVVPTCDSWFPSLTSAVAAVEIWYSVAFTGFLNPASHIPEAVRLAADRVHDDHLTAREEETR